MYGMTAAWLDAALVSAKAGMTVDAIIVDVIISAPNFLTDVIISTLLS